MNYPRTGNMSHPMVLANVGQVREPSYEFTLYGITGAKKNRYTPKKGGMSKGQDLRDELNDLESQMPGDVRDLRLESPVLAFSFKSRTARRDRDGIVTTVLDIMVKCGVIVQDNIAHCNGRMVIEPAEVCDEDSVTVRIYPQ